MQTVHDRSGWKRRSPKGRFARRDLRKKCGARCFLIPKTEGFPVCQSLKASKGKCVTDCSGLRAAFARARQTHRAGVARAALKQACRAKCKWPLRNEKCPT